MVRHALGIGLWVTVFVTAFQTTAAAQFTAGPFCSSSVTQNCIVSVATTNPNTTPTGVSAGLLIQSGVYTLAIVNSNNSSNTLELTHSTNGLTTASVVTVVFKVASGAGAVDPKIAVSTGLISSWSVNTSVTPHEVTFVASPRASSWNRQQGCQPSSCAESADVDFTALLLAAFDPMSAAPSSQSAFVTAYTNGFIATNAQYFSPFPTYSSSNNALSFFVGSPHFKANGSTLNTGFVRVFIPEAVITNLWQVSGGSAALAANNGLTTVTVGGSAASFTIEQVTSGSTALGALVKVGETTAFGFSVPEVVVRPATNANPTISDVANQTVNEDTATSALAVTVGDAETAVASLSLSGSSNNLTLVPNANIVFGGSGANRTVTVTPAANQSGTATITLTVTDGGNATATDTFVLTVNAVNDAPTISDVTNKTTAEDTTLADVAITIADIETATSSLTMSGSSSDTSLVSNSAIVFGGSGANRTVSITPSANQSGTATITLTVSDGNATASDTFVLTVTAVNDAPTIADVTNKTTNEDTALANVAVTIGDVETAAGSLTLTGSSSNITLVPNGSIVFGGSGANRTVSITPAANQSGTATITLTVGDGSATATDTFDLTVTAVNDAPTISDVTNKTTAEDTALADVAITLADIDSAVASLTVSGSSSNTSLVPNSAIVVSGSDANRTVAITPAANATGTATITLTVSDGTASGTDTFELTVTAVNDAPTIAVIAAQSGAAGRLVGPIAVTVADIDSSVDALTLAAASSNSVVVAASGLSTGGSGASRTVSAQTSTTTGTSVITLTVSDGSLSASTAFDIVSLHAAPTGFTATADGSLVNLSWTAPTTGGDISNYRVELGPSTGATTVTLDAGTTTSLAASTLAAGTYFSRVRAINSIGTGAASNEMSFTLTGAPSRPRNLVASLTGNALTLTWQSPLAGTVTGYNLEAGSATGLSNLAVVPLGTGTSFSASVPNGTFFTRVRAVNSAGQSNPSNEASFSAGPALPGAPQNLQVIVSGPSVQISWSAPASGGEVAGYILEAGSATGLANLAMVPVGGTSLNVPVVPSGTYFIRVRATNAMGTGPASNERSFTVGSAPLLPPGAPTNLTASVSGSTVTLSWTAPTTGGTPTNYTLQAGSAPGLSNLAAVAIGATTTFSASGVPAGTYYLRVLATNAAGASGASNEITVVVP